jgi:hypothetical protein
LSDARLVRASRDDRDLRRLEVEVPQQQRQHRLADAAETQHDDLALDGGELLVRGHDVPLVVEKESLSVAVERRLQSS